MRVYVTPRVFLSVVCAVCAGVLKLMASKGRKKKVAGRVRTLYKGKRGGEYYMSKGRKVYVK